VADTLDRYPLRTALVTIARDFHARGWMAGTAGNLSARAPAAEGDGDSFWITASGRPKGRLDEDDLIRVSVAGEVVEQPAGDLRPSAEAAIHGMLYQLFQPARVVLHTHTVEACLASRLSDGHDLRLPPLEMIKGFDIWEPEPRVDLPLFDNLLDIGELANQIKRRFTLQSPPIPALLIRDHGVTVWGQSFQQAYHHMELMEFILRYMALRPHTP
jgi:methylthioribulose-1-phosphate dehydratase